MESSIEFTQKLKIGLSHDMAIPLLGIYVKKTKMPNLKRYMHSRVHQSVICNSQDMETRKMPINR